MIEKFISEPLPPSASELVDKFKGTLLICAGAQSVWRDINEYSVNAVAYYHLMAVNDIGMFLPHQLEHWYSNHGDQLPAWMQVRAFHHQQARYVHTAKHQRNGIPWPVPTSGTSTLSAVYVALCLGYDRIILCGAPLDNSPHFFEGASAVTNFSAEGQHDIWDRANREIFEGRVKSMSGASRAILGAP